MLFTTLSCRSLFSLSLAAFPFIISVPLSSSLSPLPSSSLGTNIEHYDRLSLIWCSQQRWPSTLNMSTNLSTASTSHWPLWRRTGWDLTWRNAAALPESLTFHPCVEIAPLLLSFYHVFRRSSSGWVPHTGADRRSINAVKSYNVILWHAVAEPQSVRLHESNSV